MRSVFVFTIIIVITSVYSQHPLLRNLETLQKAVPNHWKNDQEKFDGRMDKVPWGHQIEAHLPHLRPHQTIPWKRWVQEGRLTAQANRNTELHRVRARLLEEKLKPNHLIFKPHIKPQNKPKLKTVHNVRTKREIDQENEGNQPVLDEEQHIRQKRSEIIAPQFIPEMVMQPHIQAASIQLTEPQNTHPDLKLHFYNPSIFYPDAIDALANKTDPYQGRIADSEKRDKRQILIDIIDQPTQLMARIPRTTPNPFIRETNIDDYDIIRPEVGEREGIVPKVDSIYSEIENFPLMSETSDLNYESDYTISMSDSEDWHNYPLTTPSAPNPAWRLSTLADIYQKQIKDEKWKHNMKQGSKAELNLLLSQSNLLQQADQTLRLKRSPKEKKKKIGAYKEKLKRRRKMKDIRRKRRIIRNSKEDKAVKEDLRDEAEVEKLLQRPRILPRQTAYQEDIVSNEILWSNGTHRIVEDKGAKFKWYNKTHYIIYKDKNNVTDDWYNQHHVLCCDEEYLANITSQGDLNEDDYYDDESIKGIETKKVRKKKKPEQKKKKKDEAEMGGKKAKKKVKKKDGEGTEKKKKKVKDEKQDIGKKVKKVKKKDDEDIVKKKKKIKDQNPSDSSDEEAITQKKKTSKTDDEKNKDSIGKKKKVKKKDKESDADKKDGKGREKTSKETIKKNKVVKKEEKETESKKQKRQKENKEDVKKDLTIDEEKEADGSLKMKKREKKKKKIKTDKSNVKGSDQSEKKKKKKESTKEADKSLGETKTRKKRNTDNSQESRTAEVKWERIDKSEDDGWTFFGKEKSENVYDASYELVETKNSTNENSR